MKRSQRGCRGCEAKACGASTWTVGFVVGAHYASREEDGIDLCARHLGLARDASVKALVSLGRGIEARMGEPKSEPPDQGKNT